LFFYILIFPLLYFFLPISLAHKLQNQPYSLLALFYLVNILTGIYLFKKNSHQRYQLRYQTQNLEEKINLLNDEIAQEKKNNLAFGAKIIRYNSLKKIIEQISQYLDLDSVAESLTSIAFSAISNHKGVCVLYLVDAPTQKLALFKTKKEDKKLIIKAKEGDIFDFWVLRHNNPLLIEDIRKDFRFDLEKLKNEDSRPVSSLISAPFISENRFLGLLRLDSPKLNFYSQDDLRFLMTISDLGAVALENSELYQRMQELAIHDGLTTLFTKGYFLERLSEECKRSVRQNLVFSLAMLDIDYFKNYNDKFGHTAGDIVLKRLSLKLIDFLKDKNSIIGRFGGEEFSIILEGIDKEEARNIASLLRQEIEKEKIILRRQETNITVSIGVAAFPQDGVSEDELIRKSDEAMYRAKEKGRNQVCCI
jgi:diguanylate cyclase (GGDEF)-like protein